MYITDAHEVKKRAERRIGELMKLQKEKVGLNKGTAGSGQPKKGGLAKNPPKDTRPTLGSQGISKSLAHSARKEAAKPQEQFEREIEQDRERIASPVKAKTVNEKPKPKKVVDVRDAVVQCVEKVRSTVEGTLQQMRCGHLSPDSRVKSSCCPKARQRANLASSVCRRAMIICVRPCSQRYASAF